MTVPRAFVTPNGECPYQDFIAELERNGTPTKRIEALVSILAEKGFDLARNNLIAHVEDKIWELKSGPFRVFFFNVRGVFVLLNGYRKKGRKTPKQELDRARSLWAQASQEGGL